MAVNSRFMTHVAQTYGLLTHQPKAPHVRQAYQAFGSEVMAQFRRLTYYGVKVEFTPNDPYPTSKALREDIDSNRRLRVLEPVSLPEGHPLLWTVDDNGHTLNSYFRAVHDFYGHYLAGNPFSMEGEYRAYLAHCEQFRNPLSHCVLTTETLGQNAWFNFGPYHYLPANHRPFAPQKAAIMPHGVIEAGIKGAGLL